MFGTSVPCPLHNWPIGLANGFAQSPDESCTARFQVEVRDGAVHLRATELASHAIEFTRPLTGPGAMPKPEPSTQVWL